MNAAAAPTARLSGFYFFYYAAVGAFVPYWALWLRWRGLSPAEIGLVFAAMAATRTAMPVLWGWLADRLPGRMPLIRLACVLALAVFVAIPLTRGFAWLVGLSMAYNAFWNAILPQFEVVTLNHLREASRNYSRIRAWGSVGFVSAVTALGPLLDKTGIAPLPWIIAPLLVLMLAAALRVPDSSDFAPPSDAARGFVQAVLRPQALALLAACFLSQLSFAPYYGFFSLYLEKHEYSRGAIGALWALGVLAEIGVLFYMSRLLPRFGARRLMLFALATTALRWWLLAAFVDSRPAMVLVQLLHLSSFGVYHACAIHYVQRFFPGRLQGRGQALYNALSYGAGGAIGSYAGGQVWEAGSPAMVYLGAGLAAVAATIVAARGLRD